MDINIAHIAKIEPTFTTSVHRTIKGCLHSWCVHVAGNKHVATMVMKNDGTFWLIPDGLDNLERKSSDDDFLGAIRLYADTYEEAEAASRIIVSVPMENNRLFLEHRIDNTVRQAVEMIRFAEGISSDGGAFAASRLVLVATDFFAMEIETDEQEEAFMKTFTDSVRVRLKQARETYATQRKEAEGLNELTGLLKKMLGAEEDEDPQPAEGAQHAH